MPFFQLGCGAGARWIDQADGGERGGIGRDDLREILVVVFSQVLA
jgi:hypothetical protein